MAVTSSMSGAVTKCCSWHDTCLSDSAKCGSCLKRSGKLPKFKLLPRLRRKVTSQQHDIVRLPRRGTLEQLPRRVIFQGHAMCAIWGM